MFVSVFSGASLSKVNWPRAGDGPLWLSGALALTDKLHGFQPSEAALCKPGRLALCKVPSPSSHIPLCVSNKSYVYKCRLHKQVGIIFSGFAFWACCSVLTLWASAKLSNFLVPQFLFLWSDQTETLELPRYDGDEITSRNALWRVSIKYNGCYSSPAACHCTVMWGR